MVIDSRAIEILQAKKLLTCYQVAQAAGISANCYYMAKKRGECSAKTAGKIAKALGVPVESLLEDGKEE